MDAPLLSPSEKTMPEYTHTLIPDGVDFVPDAARVGAFLEALESAGATPLKPTVGVAKLSGEFRTFLNPFTGVTESHPRRKWEVLPDLNALPAALKDLEDFNVTVEGKGPPKLPAFAFDFEGEYDFVVRCCLRREVVSTSDWHGDVQLERKVEPFGRSCHPDDRLGVFHNPNTLKVIEVPNAGCARFWIEFEFGKMLFPRIEDRLDLIEPTIVEVAQREFGVMFVQGCLWGA